MFDKKCLFGGLCLGNAVAIFTSISGDVIAQDDIRQVINPLLQIKWRIHAHNIIEEKQSKVNIGWHEYDTWCTDKRYSESIKKVIGKAIADCITNMNEFQGKKAGELITFENTAPKDYEQKHWNAVMLYNYVNKMIRWGVKQDYGDNEKLKQEIMADCYNKLTNHYSTKYSDINLTLLKKAQSDILEYVNVFKVDLAIFNYVKCLDKNGKFKAENLEKLYCMLSENRFSMKYGNKVLKYFERKTLRLRYEPYFKCVNGQIYIEAISIEKQDYYADYKYYSRCPAFAYGKKLEDFKGIMNLFSGLGIQILDLSEKEKRIYDAKNKGKEERDALEFYGNKLDWKN